MTWTKFGSGGTGGLKLGPEQNTFTGADLAAAEAARDAYFASNAAVLAAYDSNPSNLIRLVYEGETTFMGRSLGAWMDYSPVVEGQPGEVASLTNVPIGQVPYKLPDGTFGGSRMRVLDDGSLLAPPNFGVESGSVKFGDVLTLSEAAGFLAITNHLNGVNYTLLDYATPRSAASGVPTQFRLAGAETQFNAQPIDTTTLTTNPLISQYTVQNTARNNALTFRTGASMANVRIAIRKVSNNVVVKYVPNKEAWETEVGGLTWAAGDNTFDFDDTPLIFNSGDVISFEIRATSVSIKGSPTVPYIVSTQQTGAFFDAVMEDQYTATDIVSKLSGLTGVNRLPAIAIKGLVESVAGRTGVVTLLAGDIGGLAPVASSGAYNDLTGKPTIPTLVSQLTNDSGYLTSVPVTSVNAQTGAVVLVASDVGLGNVDNTSDVNKPTSTAQQASIDAKMAQHNAAGDPHPQYTTTAEAAAAAPVQTVNGLTGAVVISTGNIAESGNLFYTDSRVQTYITGAGYNVKSASSIGAGSAIYQGNTSGALAFRSIIGTGAATVTQNANDITINVPSATVASVNGQTGVVSLSTTDISEGTNLYYTTGRVTSYLSTNGYTVKSVASSGTGSSLFVGNTSGAVTLRSIIGTGIASVTQNSNDITINVPAAPVSSVNGLTGAVILNTGNIAEITNLYYTDARVGAYLTTNGYVVKTLASVGSGASLVANVGPSATIRSVIGAGLVTVTQNTNDITVSTPTIASGTYTPTLTNVSGVTTSTVSVAQYMRVGSTVTVSGQITIDPTGAGGGANVSIGLTLPVASNIANVFDCAGTAVSPGVVGQCGAISGDATNDRASLTFVSSSGSNQVWYYQYTYRVI